MIFSPRFMAAPTDAASPAVEWEETGCLLCGSRNGVQIIEAPDNIVRGGGLWFAVVQCQECGLCFTNPRPSPPCMSQFYPSAYWPERARSPKDKKALGLKRHRWYRWSADRKMLPWHGDGRLLDFGCGGGSFLYRMHRQGWRVTGVDISATAIKRIRTDLGLTALVGTLPHPDLDPGGFDVITMWHSLEHVHDPREVLRQAYFLLAPGGKLVVEVPNIESLPFQWFGLSWYGLDLPRHLTHFTPQTLTRMLERTGYRVGSPRMVRQTSWWRTSARLACQRRGGSPWHQLLKSKPSSRLASWLSCLMGQSDCMMLTAERGD